MMHPNVLADFEAEVRLVPNEAGVMPNVKAGWRTDIRYFEDAPNMVWMVWVAEWIVDGSYLQEFDPIPPVAVAQFAVWAPELRPIHEERIKVGVQFRIVEGWRTIALARVTRILHLNNHAQEL
jgi:hypothetical protein